MSWFPAFFRSDSTFTSSSVRRMFSRPAAWARVDVPIFTTILICFPSLSYESEGLLYHRRGEKGSPRLPFSRA